VELKELTRLCIATIYRTSSPLPKERISRVEKEPDGELKKEGTMSPQLARETEKLSELTRRPHPREDFDSSISSACLL
jgi:hypothetical protein